MPRQKLVSMKNNNNHHHNNHNHNSNNDDDAAYVQAAQQGDSTKVDKRRKKKQKEQAEDEAFLDNAQDDAEYQEGASGIFVSPWLASLLHERVTQHLYFFLPNSGCHADICKPAVAFLTLNLKLAGVYMHAPRYTPKIAMRVSEQTVGSMGPVYTNICTKE